MLICIASENGAARRDRQAQRGNRWSEILRTTLRGATSSERSSKMRRTAHTVQQKTDVGKHKQATVRQQLDDKAFEHVRCVNRLLEIRSESVPLLRNVRSKAESK